MKYDDLTDEAKGVINGMIEFCLRNHYCMGMDEGYKDYESDEKHDFRIEIENFIKEATK